MRGSIHASAPLSLVSASTPILNRSRLFPSPFNVFELSSVTCQTDV
jgi:hypothetical protein